MSLLLVADTKKRQPDEASRRWARSRGLEVASEAKGASVGRREGGRRVQPERRRGRGAQGWSMSRCRVLVAAGRSCRCGEKRKQSKRKLGARVGSAFHPAEHDPDEYSSTSNWGSEWVDSCPPLGVEPLHHPPTDNEATSEHKPPANPRLIADARSPQVDPGNTIHSQSLLATLSIPKSVAAERLAAKYLQLETPTGKVSEERKAKLKKAEGEKDKTKLKRVREGTCGLVGRRRRVAYGKDFEGTVRCVGSPPGGGKC